MAANLQTRRILEALERQPGVLRVGASTNLPTGSQFNMLMQFPDAAKPMHNTVRSRPGFLQVFGIPLLAGRGFDAQRDVAGGVAGMRGQCGFLCEIICTAATLLDRSSPPSGGWGFMLPDPCV